MGAIRSIMANLQIVIVARNMAGGALRELNGELRDLDNHAGFASRGISGLQGAVRAGLALSLIPLSEPTRLAMTSYAVFCLKKTNCV